MAMDRYEVYLYEIPKLTEDKKGVLPGPTSRTEQFDGLDKAIAFAASEAKQFDRVVVMKITEAGQKLVERYVDGKREEPPRPAQGSAPP